MCGIDIALLLIAAAVGYKICAIASEKKGGLRKLGYVVGAFILVASMLALGCTLGSRHAGKFGFCPKPAEFKSYCPVK